mgnify:CR=1 FL=1
MGTGIVLDQKNSKYKFKKIKKINIPKDVLLSNYFGQPLSKIDTRFKNFLSSPVSPICSCFKKEYLLIKVFKLSFSILLIIREKSMMKNY